MKQFLELPRIHEVFFNFPIRRPSDGKIRVEMIGKTKDVVREALAGAPPELDLTIERIGPYPDAGEHILTLLTDRQREVLDIALYLGYYDIPRQATHCDIAERWIYLLERWANIFRKSNLAYSSICTHDPI